MGQSSQFRGFVASPSILTTKNFCLYGAFMENCELKKPLQYEKREGGSKRGRISDESYWEETLLAGSKFQQREKFRLFYLFI